MATVWVGPQRIHSLYPMVWVAAPVPGPGIKARQRRVPKVRCRVWASICRELYRSTGVKLDRSHEFPSMKLGRCPPCRPLGTGSFLLIWCMGGGSLGGGTGGVTGDSAGSDGDLDSWNGYDCFGKHDVPEL